MHTTLEVLHYHISILYQEKEWIPLSSTKLLEPQYANNQKQVSILFDF